MNFEKEYVEMPDPEFPIKTYIVDSEQRILSANYHFHEEIEIIFMVQGEMTFWIEDDDIKVKEGNILLIRNMVVHASNVKDGCYVRMGLLQFKPAIIYNTGHFSEFKYLLPFLQSNQMNYKLMDSTENEDYKDLMKLLLKIDEEFQEKSIAYEIAIKSILYQILTVLYRSNILNFRLMDNLANYREPLKRLEKIIHYMENHYMENIDLEDACELLDLNYYYFCRLFKKATGSTFIQYLNFIRLSVAERFLLTTNMPVTEIIMETGFSSLSYFNRAFKKFKGFSPTVYRKNARLNKPD